MYVTESRKLRDVVWQNYQNAATLSLKVLRCSASESEYDLEFKA